jgi:hypothetical protein
VFVPASTPVTRRVVKLYPNHWPSFDVVIADETDGPWLAAVPNRDYNPVAC